MSGPSSQAFDELLEGFRRRLEPALAAWIEERRRRTAGHAREAVELTDALQELVAAGGKRLRPALVHFGYLACGGADEERVLPLAMSTELLHTYLLIHDDIMDHADTRRGAPAVHARFGRRHRASGWRGDGDDYGVSMAILVGDLAHSFALELFISTAVDGEAASALHQAFFAMCQEVIDGQYLEMHQGLERDPSAADLERVLRLKSGLYSVERPLQLGAILAGAASATASALSRYGRAVGEAFQLQDDLLGVFGDPGTTGKPVGADLCEGKFTFLVHYALEGSDDAGRRRTRPVLGNADAPDAEVAEACALLRGSGAETKVQEMIAERSQAAVAALAEAELAPAGRCFLGGLVDYLHRRRH